MVLLFYLQQSKQQVPEWAVTGLRHSSVVEKSRVLFAAFHFILWFPNPIHTSMLSIKQNIFVLVDKQLREYVFKCREG